MATTVNDLIRAAIATSRHNVRDGTASDAELIALIGDLLEQYMTEGAALNRRFFGARFVVDFDAELGGWRRPPEATRVDYMLAGTGMQNRSGLPISQGTEIIDLPIDQRSTEQGRPAVYQWGQVWYSAGRPSDPASGELVILGSRRPSRPETVESPIDPLWPEMHNPLLKWNLALYLAQKDGERDAEVALFTRLRDEAHALFVAFLKAESTTEVRAYGHGGFFPDPGVSPR